MMSLETIRRMSATQARKSAAAGRLPLGVESDDLLSDEVLLRHVRHIPNLGDRTPRGFTKVEDLFVDASGFGGDNEPALSQGQFLAKVKANGPGFYYSICETGQFQVYIRVMTKNRHDQGGN